MRRKIGQLLRLAAARDRSEVGIGRVPLAAILILLRRAFVSALRPCRRMNTLLASFPGSVVLVRERSLLEDLGTKAVHTVRDQMGAVADSVACNDLLISAAENRATASRIESRPSKSFDPSQR